MLQYHEQHYFPAEWERQRAILITWPHRHSDWVTQLTRIEKTYLEMAIHIAHYQPLIIMAYDHSHAEHIKERLTTNCHMDNIQILVIQTNDTWIRDYGPISTYHGNTLDFHDFGFNAWGGKFSYNHDNQVTEQFIKQCAWENVSVKKNTFILEGGNLETDGHGTLLTKRQCLCDPKRNPGMSEDQIKTILQNTLSIKKFLFLDHGDLEGDDTDGHIDILARFCNPHTICYTAPANDHDHNARELKKMEAQLKTFTDCAHNPYALIPLPCPTPIYDTHQKQFAANYTNFLIINDAVLIPTFHDPADDIALERLGACFPTRKMIPIDARVLVKQGGTIHCATMQIPMVNQL
jgi:agmatine deiminase